MIKAADKVGVCLGAIFPQRFNPVLQAVHAASATGRFGDLAVASSAVPWWRDDTYYGAGRWQGSLALDGGGALMNQSIHGVDALQWIAHASMPHVPQTLNPVEKVAAFAALKSHDRRHVEVEDTCLAVLQLKNGGLGQLLATTSLFPGNLRRFIFGGRGGTAEVEEEQIVNWQFRESHSEDDTIRSQFCNISSTTGGAADPMAINYSCHTRNFQQFFDALRAGEKPQLDGHEGRKAVAIIEACYKSAATGKFVKISD
jgi:predicted dehydrogenase